MENFDIEFPAQPARHCSVFFGSALFARAAEYAATLSGGSGIAVISDGRVASFYGDKLIQSLHTAGAKADLVTFPAGEDSKNWQVLGRLLQRLVELRIGRDGLVVALGGGVTGDLAGMAAALHCRGIAWLQLPTTTLAMADSALGGKTAVNVGGAKNLAGAFHQPAAIFADLDTLSTLEERHFRSGLAEAVKTALIIDSGLFAQLESGSSELLERSGTLLQQVLSRCSLLKAGVIARDEREAGERAVLNAGHTIGHALETASGGSLLHGEAVAIGLVLECGLAERLCRFPGEDLQRLVALLQALDLPTTIPQGITPEDVKRLMSADKKIRAGELRFALPGEIGRAAVTGSGWTISVDSKEVIEVLKKGVTIQGK